MARITHPVDGASQWFVRWNRKWEYYALIGGHLEPGETYRECLLREIREEIGLQGNAIRVAEAPVETLSYVAFSKRANEETRYTLCLFDVRIPQATCAAVAEQDDRLRWVSGAEIESGHTRDGKEISDVVGRFHAILNTRET
ncbi:MAG: NUDIX hydrolase [Verrucomicrobia bacterium]|nr:NUDIX hydrolase [Verrucomicrobiota bacterium]